MSEMTIRDTTATLATARLQAQPRRGIPPWLRWGSWVPTLITFVIAALLWQIVAWTNPYVLPTLEAVGASLVDDAGMYWSNFLVTLLEVVVGAAAGILAGFLLAVVMAEFQLIERAVMPLVIIVMVTPIVAIAPALVVAFGFGMVPKFIVTGLVVFFPMLVNSLAGLRDVDHRALDVFKTLHASRWEIFRELRFPGSMPYVFAGLRIALPLAVVGAAVAEFVAAGQQAGLGSLVTTSAAQANLAVTWASIALLCLLGVLLIIVLALVRKRVLWWSDGEVTAKG
ncbi:Riboflavin transport system permease protein RibX [Microbacterium oxydans]|uniref:Putative aliphatic sulfonates transport permease protein SsuC n=1 Tax=Microbacterium oxydans TaxID=82380 RepID=A0A0F0L974_9MICO|nr:ABC transporter permease [Microbacterium oxydans]KJL29737.1 putative aliphatic sulfonates transport permease protein SsuC [Microbacterium oxydans]CAH0154588.1 Riboflavin transport system permease protein RibX [Microbacterium oxydans]